MSQVFITGSSGFVGRHLLEAARRNNTEVILVTRSSERVRQFASARFISFYNFSTEIQKYASDDSCIIHLAGASRDVANCSLWEANCDGTDAVIRAAREGGVRRIIYLSGFGTEINSSVMYFKAKAYAEQMIKGSNIPSTVFRASYILGEGDELTPFLHESLLGGKVEIPGDGHYRIQPLFVGDVAEVLLTSCKDTSRNNYVYDLLGDQIRYLDYVKLVAAKLSLSADIVSVPIEEYIRRAIHEPDPTFTLDELAILVSDLVGPPTPNILGTRLRPLLEFVDRVLDPAKGRIM